MFNASNLPLLSVEISRERLTMLIKCCKFNIKTQVDRL